MNTSIRNLTHPILPAAMLVLAAAILSFGIVVSAPAFADDTQELTPVGAPAVDTAADLSTVTAPVVTENPYGLGALWQAGDFVARGTLIILVIMSMGSWYILVTKLLEQGKLFRHASAANKKFWATASVQEGCAALDDNSPFRYIADTGVEANVRHVGSLIGKIDQHTWVTMSIQRAVDTVQSRLQGGLAFLATVGSTAPFVGLFGTVWGIYHALTAIGIAGQASIDKVAGPVGEALIMTAIGLAVAVPAVLGYNWLVRRNKSAVEQIRTFSAELHATLIGTPTAASATAEPKRAMAGVR
jgi:biopolymer transport protein ExbB